MLTLLVISAATKTAYATLQKGIGYADLIVVGRVVRRVPIQGYSFADLVVEQTLKGSPSKWVRFVAEPTHGSDWSDAKVGERGVYFLYRHLGHSGDPSFPDA